MNKQFAMEKKDKNDKKKPRLSSFMRALGPYGKTYYVETTNGQMRPINALRSKDEIAKLKDVSRRMQSSTNGTVNS